jgi:hypothetical protein
MFYFSGYLPIFRSVPLNLNLVQPKSSLFLDIVPCSPLKVTRLFGVTQFLALCFMLVSSLAYSLVLKMEVICSTETSVDFERTLWCYVPEYAVFLGIQ